MGKGQSKEATPGMTPEEIEEVRILKVKVDTEGPKAIDTHIRENLDKWLNEGVKIGITGRCYTGKSTFINKILGLTPYHAGAAKTGSGNTTCRVTHYEHPTNPKFSFYDCPGNGSPEFPKSTYMSYITESRCDYFLIFFDGVISEDDLWLAENLRKIRKPFCFVRSMIDKNIENAKYDGKDESEVIAEIRKKATDTIMSNRTLEGSNIFLISGRNLDIGDYKKLLTHIEGNVPSLKFESIIFSISTSARDVIEMNYKKLKTRIRTVAVGTAAISASPIPIADLLINMALLEHEIKLYIQIFGLGPDNVRYLPEEIKKKLQLGSNLLLSSEPASMFIRTQLVKANVLVAAQSIADSFFPILGLLTSAPTTLIVVYRFLSKVLDDLRTDALTVYDNMLETRTRQS